MPVVNVFLTAEMATEQQLASTTCVVIDIFRATSCWVTALTHGARAIHPIIRLKECKQLGQKGYLTAAERDGKKVEGFDLGNSPFEYTEQVVKGKRIAVTTTNGTRAVRKAMQSREVLIGAFLNINALAERLKEKEQVSILCAGWEGHPGMEDVLFAGELVSLLINTHQSNTDGPLIAFELYKKARNNMTFFLSQAIHYRRLMKLGLKKDIEYCLKRNTTDVVPVVRKEEIVVL